MDVKHENMQNLICKMIVRGDISLTDWSVLFYPIVDVGARAFVYNMILERQLKCRWQLDMRVTPLRKVKLANHQVNIHLDSEQLKNILP